MTWRKPPQWLIPPPNRLLLQQESEPTQIYLGHTLQPLSHVPPTCTPRDAPDSINPSTYHHTHHYSVLTETTPPPNF